MNPGIFLALALLAPSQADKAPTIELITMGPGPYLYSFWGHAALRVREPTTERGRGRDIVYNFGSVDFSGNFFVRMMRGQIDAYVSISSFNRTVMAYSKEDRTITRRVLALEPEQARRIADRLSRYVGAQRITYRYHHFADNCSTRVADEIDLALGGQLSKSWTQDTGLSHREQALQLMRGHTIFYAAIDLILNGQLDRPISTWESRFLPHLFVAKLDQARVDGAPVVGFQFDLHRSKSYEPGVEWTWPWFKIYLFLILPIALLCGLAPRAGALVWWLFSGLLGLVMGILWVGTSYDFLANNWNLLVLPPWNLLFAVLPLTAKWWERTLPWVWRAVAAHTLLLLGIAVLNASGVIQQNMQGPLGAAVVPGLILTLKMYKWVSQRAGTK